MFYYKGKLKKRVTPVSITIQTKIILLRVIYPKGCLHQDTTKNSKIFDISVNNLLQKDKTLKIIIVVLKY